MKNIAIITLDVVASSRLSKPQLEKFMEKSDSLTQFSIIEKVEVFRGDGLQTYVPIAKNGLRAAIIQYCFFNNMNIKVRQSLGIGKISLLSKELARSIGSAFELSGKGLEPMKQEQLLLAVHFEGQLVQEEWKVLNFVISDLMKSWSQAQAEVVLSYLMGETQVEIAQKLGVSQAAINQRLKSAKVHLLQIIINRFENLTL